MSDRMQALKDDLTAARGELRALLARLRPEEIGRPTANEGWSVHDLLAHLTSIETRLRAMWQHALDGREGAVPGPSLDEFNATCVAERRNWSLAQLATEFERTGDETGRFLDQLGPADLDKRWTHPARGEVTVESLLWIAPRHLREHLEQLTTATGG